MNARGRCLRFPSIPVALLTLIVACTPENQPADELEESAIDPAMVYGHTIHLEGLDEDVKIHKTPERIWLERTPGVFEDYTAVLDTDRRVYRERFGALARDFHDELSAAGSQETFTVGIVYRSPTVNEMVLNSPLRDDNEALAEARALDVVPIVETIQANGLTVHRTPRYLRYITAEGRADQILGLAHDDQILVIYHQKAGTATELAAIHPAVHHDIDAEYLQPMMGGSYATDIKVGIIEPSSYDDANDFNCGIRESHDAFSEATVTYSDPLKLCNPMMPSCGNCDTCVEMGFASPNSGQCVESHPTQVSSLVANTQGASPYAAARAHLYVPNEWEICDGLGGTADVYDWLLGQGVHTANASYVGCDSGEADIAIRDNDLFIARGAGNSAMSSGNATVACEATANSLCVGATILDHTLACYSNWKNPWNHSNVPDTLDREEPDVVAVGGDVGTGCAGNPVNSDNAVSVASHSSTDSTWTTGSGTSFSAPTITAMAALLREECADANDWTDRVLRAIFRTGAHAYNPYGTRYSTPNNDGVDGRDGGGWASANDISIFCDPGSNAGEDIFQLDTGDGTTIDGELGRYDPDSPVENLEPTNSEDWRAFTDPGSGRVYHVIKYLPAVSVDYRIRATISWDACPAVNVYWTAAARDIDLFLLKVDSVMGNSYEGTWVTGSQSVSDNNEGFDFKVTSADDYLIVAGWAAGDNVGCEGSDTEPFGWAARVLAP